MAGRMRARGGKACGEACGTASLPLAPSLPLAAHLTPILTLNLTLSLVLALACAVVSAVVLGGCAAPATTGGPGESVPEAAVEGARAQAGFADVAGTVSVRAAAGGEDGAGDARGADGMAAGALVYVNERFGFVAELPAGYVETEVANVVDGADAADAVVLSATDERLDACLILTHELGEDETGDGDGVVAAPQEAGVAGVADAGTSVADDAGAGDAEAIEDVGDAARDANGETDQIASDDGQTVADAIDEWATTYGRRAIAELEGYGATVTRAEIGRATLAGAPCTIVEIEFEPQAGTAHEPSGEGPAPAHRDIFFFDGERGGSRVALVVDCLAWSQEALDELENSFVAR